ncbi:hypothetical protein [Streptomyces sp. NPDC053048]|uniref:hypothetical protein n=1 Tax=Streptomyces sp. NPDC053048 TaxID=3365694 RepID=UPI0037D6C828
MRIASAVGVVSSALWLPRGQCTVEEAVIDGILSDAAQAPPDVDGVPQSRGETPEFMAAEAARLALSRAGSTAQDVDILAYAWTLRIGYEFYSPAHRLAKELSLGDCSAFSLCQACNGGALAVESIVMRMLTDERVHLGVAVSSDTYEEFGSRRWAEPTMMVGGDGAAAVVLTRGPGELALRSLATRGHTCADILEVGQGMRHRVPGTGGAARPPSETELKEAAHSVEKFGASLSAVVHEALKDADLGADDQGIAAVLLPRLATPFTDAFVRPAMPEALRDKAYVADPHTGHLGAGDALANIEYAQRELDLAPGQYLLVVNGGQGVTSSCMVLTPESR